MRRVKASLYRMDIKQEPFERLLLRLEPDYSNYEERYRNLRLKLLKFFAWRRCEDPDGLTDETIARVVKNINSGEEIRTAKAYSYVYAIATNVFKEYLRDKKKRQLLIDDMPESLPPTSEDVRDCRRQCLDNLPPDKLNLLQQYYLSEEKRTKMAESLGITLNALRLQVHRIKNDMRSCYEDCIKSYLK